jgi:hypothetical protein
MASRNPLTDPRRGDIISADGCDIGREVNHVDRFRVDYSPWKGGGAEYRPDSSCSLENWRRWCREHKATIVKKANQ